jgi:hypothetical protein
MQQNERKIIYLGLEFGYDAFIKFMIYVGIEIASWVDVSNEDRIRFSRPKLICANVRSTKSVPGCRYRTHVQGMGDLEMVA